MGKMRQLNNQWAVMDIDNYNEKIFYNALSGQIKIADMADKNKIISNIRKKPSFPKPRINFLYLYPTSDCNLRCIYCYASAGETKNYLDFKTAKIAIDYVLKRNINATVGFHGGGEPLLNFQLIKQTIDYLNNIGADTTKTIMTNGVCSEDKIKWCVDHLNAITFSFDGYPRIQNMQRPLANGGKSYTKLLKSLKLVQNSGLRYGVRSTITPYSVKNLVDIVKHFHSLKIYNIKFEPLCLTGRCTKNFLPKLNLDVFVENFLKASDYAKDHGITLSSTLSDLGYIKDSYCGACGTTFGLTPEGYISSCVEVNSIHDPAASQFIYGEIKNNEVVINKKVLKTLQRRKVDNLKECKRCFIKYNCSGDCLIKAYRKKGTIFLVDNERCGARKKIVEGQTKSIVNRVLHNDRTHTRNGCK